MAQYLIDVSEHQGIIDWDIAKSAIDGAIIRVGTGERITVPDYQFARNQSECRRLGIPHGYYWYGYLNHPIEEAEDFCSYIGPLQPGEFVVLDFEGPLAQSHGSDWALAFMQRVKQILGVAPLFYSYAGRLDWDLVSNISNAGYQLWLAGYWDFTPNRMPYDTLGWSPAGWQYTDRASVPGVAGPVDMSIFYINVNQLGIQKEREYVDVSITLPQGRQVGAHKWRIDWADNKTDGMKGYWLHYGYASGQDGEVPWENLDNLHVKVYLVDGNGQFYLWHEETGIHAGQDRSIMLPSGYIGPVEVDYYYNYTDPNSTVKPTPGYLAGTYVYQPKPV